MIVTFIACDPVPRPVAPAVEDPLQRAMQDCLLET